MDLSGQQWVFKNIVFTGTNTGVIAGGTDIVFLGCQFSGGHTAINATGTSGSLTVIDSSGSGLQTFVTSKNTGTAENSIILENIQNVGTTVTLDGTATVSGNIPNTWVHGNMVGNPSCLRAIG